jgi:hypothetical protein
MSIFLLIALALIALVIVSHMTRNEEKPYFEREKHERLNTNNRIHSL